MLASPETDHGQLMEARKGLVWNAGCIVMAEV